MFQEEKNSLNDIYKQKLANILVNHYASND